MLVTGAAGFVGSRPVPALLEAGHDVEAMTTSADRVRAAHPPAAYRRLLLGSRIEVVLGPLTVPALLTCLFVVDPRTSPALVTDLFGGPPPNPAGYVQLLVLWDGCYRIGAAWWASVAALWRSVRSPVDAGTAATPRRADVATLRFGAYQLGPAPFVAGHPVLLVAVLGHVAAVLVVVSAALALQ